MTGRDFDISLLLSGEMDTDSNGLTDSAHVMVMNYYLKTTQLQSGLIEVGFVMAFPSS